LLGRLVLQEHLADRVAIQPGHQQHPSDQRLRGPLGHGPPDYKGHERSVMDTPVLLFIWGNARCQSLPLNWFFPDTEGVTGSNPVAPTNKALTSGNAGQLAIWGRFGGPRTGWGSLTTEAVKEGGLSGV
jgi:hypothetical protein